MLRRSLYGLLGLAMLVMATDASAGSCTVVFGLDGDVAASALQFQVAYAPPGVEIDGTGSSAGCNNRAAAFYSLLDDDSGQLTAAFIALAEIDGPTDVLDCAITSDSPVTPSDFAITVVDASDALSNPLVPLPGVSVWDISCSGFATTTSSTTSTSTSTSSTSSTTLYNPSTTSTTVGGGSTSSTTSTTSTTMPDEERVCLIDLVMLDQVTLGSLQYDFHYANAPGQLEGSGSQVSCTSPVTGGFTSFNDNDGGGVLTAAIVTLSGFTGPAPVASCVFIPSYRDPIEEDFWINVVDAADPSSQAVNPFPVVEIASIDCFSGATTTTSTSTTTSTTSTTSTTTTTVPICGNGIVQAGEQCDGGETNSDTQPDACRTDCTDPVCGDDVTDGNEQCDDGGANSDSESDACRTDCTLPVCGDGVVDGNEECDDAGANSDTDADACRTDCTLPVCGDDVLDTGEACDDGGANSDTESDACRTDCTDPVCGDAVTDSGEQCDDGGENSDTQADACRTDCSAPVCGDDVVDSTEECDDGAANSDSLAGSCRTDCSEEMVCGDADGSGTVSATDAAVVLQAAVGLIAQCDPGRCDANGDGATTVIDAQTLLLHVVGLGATLSCERTVTLRLDDAVTLGALGVEIDYSQLDASFSGDGASVDCTSVLPGSPIVVFNNMSDDRVLNVSLASLTGFTGPIDVAECKLREHVMIATEQYFSVSVLDASDTSAQPVNPTPGVSVGF